MRSADDDKVLNDVEVNADQLAGDRKKPVVGSPTATPACSKGRFRINGKDFQLNCDGSRLQVGDGNAP
jgi:hypothetical protein